MAVIDSSSVDVPLSLFSSLNTELSPPDVPEGISPDNQDVIYLPGSVSTRPAIQRVFVSVLIASGHVTYEKSFVQPNKQIKNLYLTDDGQLWVEDVTNTPGVAVLLFASTATMASSVTAFGREYIALSDGIHGADVPIQYDGTNLWRVTQDGPGAPPTVTSFAYPSVAMALNGAHSDTITSITTSDLSLPFGGGSGIYHSITVTLAAPDTSLLLNQALVISGNTNAIFNNSFFVTYVDPAFAFFKCAFYSTTLQTGTGGSAAFTAGASLVRAGNVVRGTTAAAHNLQVGYQVQIGGVAASVVGLVISSIVLNNENLPGIATVTTLGPHGLLPNNIVNIAGVNGATVGTAITNVSLTGNFVTITTSSAHGLQVGSIVNVTLGTLTKLNGQWYVASVPSLLTFTYAFVDTDIASAADTGTVKYIWPLANANPDLNYFTVLTAPSATSFTIGLSYTDGTWAGGTVSFAWNGIFYVTSVPSTTTFAYQQYGPDASTTVIGTVTPYGQATPGLHQCQQCFLLQSGAITAPSPSVTFNANGGQYLNVSNLAIGPANVAARILIFTGAGGAYFFYIPQPAQVNGLVVSTATQINDNTTTSVVMDFSDATLYSAIGCSIPGNNLAAQVVLGPSAGMFTYASRLQSWGEYNKVQNFLNMGFDGGYLANTPSIPSGWSGTAAFVTGRPSGFAVQVTGGGLDAFTGISQPAYLDPAGNPILQASTRYRVRAWVKCAHAGANGALFAVQFTSASTAYTLSATVAGSLLSTTGAWVDVTFGSDTPATIPYDMLLSVGVRR